MVPRALVAVVVIGLTSAIPAHASSINSLKHKAAAIAARIDAVNVKLSILGEEYDQASARAAVLATRIAAVRAEIHTTRQRVGHEKTAVAHAAVRAYVEGDAPVVPTGNPDSGPARSTYLNAATGNIDRSVANLTNDEHRLSTRVAKLHTQEAEAAKTSAVISGAKTTAAGLQAQLTDALAGVNSRLAPLVQAQEAAQRAAAAEAAAALAKKAAQATTQPSTPSIVTTSASTAGLAAVRAAKTQLGTPYVWGGASPGAGFDCSGLAMWAWGQAGVNLPHSAAAQYASIPHVPLNALEPGDLVFYASGGYIYHVVMYIGAGRAIQAVDYGEPVQITSLWGGAVGAGRP